MGGNEASCGTKQLQSVVLLYFCNRMAAFRHGTRNSVATLARRKPESKSSPDPSLPFLSRTTYAAPMRRGSNYCKPLLPSPKFETWKISTVKNLRLHAPVKMEVVFVNLRGRIRTIAHGQFRKSPEMASILFTTWTRKSLYPWLRVTTHPSVHYPSPLLSLSYKVRANLFIPMPTAPPNESPS